MRRSVLEELENHEDIADIENAVMIDVAAHEIFGGRCIVCGGIFRDKVGQTNGICDADDTIPVEIEAFLQNRGSRSIGGGGFSCRCRSCCCDLGCCEGES